MPHNVPSPTRIGYVTIHERKGECSVIQRTLIDGRTLVIASEPPDNPGMSITSAAEYVATAVCQALGINPHQLVWIEHPQSQTACDAQQAPVCELVTFGSVTPGEALWFHDPNWHPMTPDLWRALGLTSDSYPF